MWHVYRLYTQLYKSLWTAPDILMCMPVKCVYIKNLRMYIHDVLYSTLHGHAGSVEHIALNGRTLISTGSDWYWIHVQSICMCSSNQLLNTKGTMKSGRRTLLHVPMLLFAWSDQPWKSGSLVRTLCMWHKNGIHRYQKMFSAHTCTHTQLCSCVGCSHW